MIASISAVSPLLIRAYFGSDSRFERQPDIDPFLDGTDERYVNLCLDIGQVTYAGGDIPSSFVPVLIWAAACKALRLPRNKESLSDETRSSTVQYAAGRVVCHHGPRRLQLHGRRSFERRHVVNAAHTADRHDHPSGTGRYVLGYHSSRSGGSGGERQRAAHLLQRSECEWASDPHPKRHRPACGWHSCHATDARRAVGSSRQGATRRYSCARLQCRL